MNGQTLALARPHSYLNDLVDGTGISCEVIFPSGESISFGGAHPQFRITFRNNRLLKWGFNEAKFAKAYVNGEIDIEGDMRALLRLRTRIEDKLSFFSWLKFILLLFIPETKVNAEAINSHYQLGDELFLSFIDSKYRLYSHGIFSNPSDMLEQGSENRMEDMYKSLQLKPGMRLLDIGGGWGGVTEYCGSRGVKVTALTLGENSYRYIGEVIKRDKLPCDVILEDFLLHTPKEPYDAIVILGVIEHIINYRRFFQQIRKCLKPGGLLYLDASASIEKFDVSAFAREYIWTGTHSYLCLQELIRELLYEGLELLHVENDSNDYGLSMYHWALRLDENRDKIVERFGEKLYRAYRLYLWGGAESFPDMLQAYTLVARCTGKRGGPPAFTRRFFHFLGR